MSGFALAHLDEIEEITDGRCPFRPVRHQLGISSFGVNAWTGHEAGDRIINAHDEAAEEDGQEELYLVQRGRARFELDGEQIEAAAGTFVFVRPNVERTAFAVERETTIIAFGGTPGTAYEPNGFEVWAPLGALYRAGKYAEAADRGAELIEPTPNTRRCSTTWRVARASPGEPPTRSTTSGSRSSGALRLAHSRPTTLTSTQSAMSPRSRSW